MKQSGIYKILNKANDKIYVGSAFIMHTRWQQHRSALKLGKHPSKYLQASWNKYGEENFEFIVLEIVNNRQKLAEREQHWIDLTKCHNREFGYNSRPKAENNSGLSPSNETREKLSKALTGKKRSEDTRAKMSAWQVGRKMSDEAKAKNAASTRKFDKWPHADGAFCKCRDCTDKRTEIHREYVKVKKFEKGKIVASSYISGMM